jgi:PAS domain S-box-containing protein
MQTQMKKNVLSYSLLNLIVILIVVLLYARLVYIPSQNLIKEKVVDEFTVKINLKSLFLDNIILRHVEGAKSMSSRTMIRKKIVEYNKGEISLDELKTYTLPKYIDGAKVLDNCIYAARVVKNEKIAEYKDYLSDNLDTIENNTYTKVYSKIVIKDSLIMYYVVSPIIQNNTVLGKDIIIYKDSLSLNYVEDTSISLEILSNTSIVSEFDVNNSDTLFLANSNLVFQKKSAVADAVFQFSQPESILFKELEKFRKNQLIILMLLLLLSILILGVIQRRKSFLFKRYKVNLENLIAEKTKELKEANKLIEESAQKFRTVADFTYDWEYWIDNDGGFIYVSPSVERITGYKPDEFYADKDLMQRIIHPEDIEIFDKHKHSDEEGDKEFVEFRIITKEQKTEWIGHKCQKVFNKEGKLLGIRGSNRKITERKKIEQTLKESEKKFRLLTDLSNDIIVLHRNKEKIYVNPAIEKILGYSQEEYLSVDLNILIHPDDLDYFNKLVKVYKTVGLNSGKAIDLRMKNKAGYYVWVATYAIYHELEHNDSITIFNIRDISKRKAAELENMKLSTAVLQNPATIVITDLDGNIEFVNPKFSEITGYSKEEAIGKKPSVLKSDFHTADFHKELWATIKSGKVWKGEFYNKKKDGTCYWEDAVIAPILNEKDKTMNYVAIKQDITNRKTAEFKLKEALETKNKFLSIISHDLRAPFSAIVGFSDLLHKNHLKYNDEKRAEMINYVNNSAKGAYNLLENLLTWSRVQSNKMNISLESLNLKLLVSETISGLQEIANGKNIQIVDNVSEDITVNIDKNMIATVFRNLISNAIKFTNENGAVTLSAERLKAENKLKISVSDNGVGIPKDQIGYLFRIDKNVSTQGTNDEKGTGLGLLLCKEFVKKHGGEIWVESEVDKGSTFTFSIPLNPRSILGSE